MDEAYARSYGSIARRHWWWRVRDREVLASLDRWVPPEPGRVLDVGCGDGRLFSVLRRYGTVEGIEPDSETGTVQVADGTIHRAAFDEPMPVVGPYRVITMLDVLEHLDTPVGALSLAGRLLTANGVICITVPALTWLWTSHDDLNHHRSRFTSHSLRKTVAAAGLRVYWSRYLFHSLVPLKLLQRVAERSSSVAPQPPQVPPRAIDSIIGGYFRLETSVVRPIAAWLPGSSLIAIVGRPCAS